MIENIGLFLFGAIWGAALVFECCFKRLLSQRDMLGECLREQTRQVAFLSRFAGDEYTARSEAKVTTIDGDFAVSVTRSTTPETADA